MTLDQRAVAALLAGVAGLAILYATLTPPFEGPDSGGHFRYAVWLRTQSPFAPLDAKTTAFSHELIQQPPLYYGLVALATSGMAVSPTLALDGLNPHYPGLSHRATLSPPDAAPGAEGPARVAALVSLLGALLAVLATWGLVRQLLPGQPGLALAAAAVVGLNPQFLFAAANITNDTWACATVTGAVWAAAYLARRHRPAWHWGLVGALVGAAAITKYTGLVVALPVALLWLWWARGQSWRSRTVAVLAMGLAFLAVAGWWYAGNLARAGALVPLAQLPALMPASVRSPPMSWRTALGEAAWLGHSYWGVFGYGVLASAGYYRLIEALLLAAVAGLLLLPLRLRQWPERRALARTAFLAAAWLTFSFLGWLSWSRGWRLSNQGRLLFPAAAAIAILLVLGWWALAPRRWQGRLLAAVPLVFFGLALWGAATLADAYRIPADIATLPAMDRRLDAHFEGGLSLVGVDLPAGGSVLGGDSLPLTLYLRATEPVTQPALLFVHDVTAEDRQLAGYDGVPAGGRHPVQQWRPGEAFADPYELSVAAVATDTLTSLLVGLYDPTTGRRLRLLDGDGQPVADAARVGSVMVRSKPPEKPPTAVLARWAKGITLTSARVQRAEDGTPVAVDVAWAAEQPVTTDYTLFVQLLDAEGALVSQADVKPGGAGHPTDTWVPGYPARTTVSLPPPQRPWQRLILGLYDADGRLPLVDGAGGDAFELERR